MLFDPGIDVFTANRAEHGPLDAPHKFVIQTDLVTHWCKNSCLLPRFFRDRAAFRIGSPTAVPTRGSSVPDR